LKGKCIKNPLCLNKNPLSLRSGEPFFSLRSKLDNYLNFAKILKILKIKIMCGPLCAIGIAGGLWLSRLLGINDMTLGIWIGALILAVSVQFNKFLIKRNKAFSLSFWLIFIGTWLLSFLPIWSKLSGSYNFCGVPRIVFGSFIGILTLFLSDWLDNIILKKFHRDKVYFPYQRVIIPLVALIIISAIFELWVCKLFI